MAIALTGCARGHRVNGAVPRDVARANELTMKGVDQVRAGDYAAAADLFEKALQADAYAGEAYNNLGLVYFHQGDFYQAAWHFRYAMRLLPHQPQPRNNLGLVFESAGRYDEAVAQFNDALRLQADNPELLGNLVRARLRNGDTSPDLRDQLQNLIAMDSRPQWRQWAQRKLTLLH
jgi:Flp pilus assembly protein TadD